MAKNKTVQTENSISEFIESVESEQQRIDSYELIEILESVVGQAPKMWGGSIIGFGSYHYKYASGHEGDAALIGFSPRKAAISLYVCADPTVNQDLLNVLGKYKMGKACIYIKKLTDIDTEVLKLIAQRTIEFLRETYSVKGD